MTNEAIIALPENQKLTYTEQSTFDGSPIFLVAEYELFGYEVQIVKCQWTKTQKTYGIVIKNMYTGKNSDIRITNYKLRDAKKLIEGAEELGYLQLWTGHCIKAEK